MNKIFANDLPSGSPTHPGVIILEEIVSRSEKQKEVSKKMGITQPMLSDLIHGRRNITAKLALKLEKALDISAMFWLNFQNKYDLDKARKEESLMH